VTMINFYDAFILFYCTDEEGVNHWPEILKFLFACCDLNLPHLYESALNIIRYVL